MGEVGVHLADHAVAALQAPREAGAVGHPEAVLPGAVQDVHPWALGRQRVGQLAGAIGRRVVDDEQLEAGGGEALDEAREGLRLAVGRDDDDRAGAIAAGRQRGRGQAPRRRSRAARAPALRARRRAIATSSPAKDTTRRASASAVAGPAPIAAPSERMSEPSRSPSPPGASGTRTPSSHDSAKAPRSRKASRPAVAPSARASAQAPRPVATQPAASRPTISASVRPRSGPAVSIPRACRRSWSQPPTKRGRTATVATERGDEEHDGRHRRMHAGAEEAGHRGRRARDDHGELLVAGDRHHLRGRGSDALARADPVGEADDAAGLVAQQERARPHARQRAGRAAGADAPQSEREGQPLQQRGDGEERDGEDEQPVVDRPVEAPRSRRAGTSAAQARPRTALAASSGRRRREIEVRMYAGTPLLTDG